MAATPVLGMLIPTQGSIKGIEPVKISHRVTTIGRDPRWRLGRKGCGHNRMPKRAIGILLSYKGFEEDTAERKTDWRLNERLTAFITTHATAGIQVNGIALRQKDCHLRFGELKMGDVITVFGPTVTAECKPKYLKFHFVFFAGTSKNPRAMNDPFVVKKRRAGMLVEGEKPKSMVSKSDT